MNAATDWPGLADTAACTSPIRSLRLKGFSVAWLVVRRVSPPSGLTVTIIASVGGAGTLSTLGRFTEPDWIIGAVTMKMTSRTSITSM